MQNIKKVKMIAVCGIFSALALALYLVPFFRIPMGLIFSYAPFLKLNFSDIPILVAGFAYGPIAGSIIVVIKILFKLLMTSSGYVGELADLFVSLSFILTATLIYKYRKDKKGALLGLVIASLVSSVVACFVNYYMLLPMYHFNGDYLLTILYGVLPFNLVKNILISFIVMIIYKKISKVITKYGGK